MIMMGLGEIMLFRRRGVGCVPQIPYGLHQVPQIKLIQKYVSGQFVHQLATERKMISIAANSMISLVLGCHVSLSRLNVKSAWPETSERMDPA